MDVSLTVCLWSAVIAVPLVLTSNDLYKAVFPVEWYDSNPRESWNNPVYPSPLGLSLGILAVVVGQIFVLVYFWARQAGLLGKLTSVQKAGAPSYNFSEGLFTHLSQPEGFVMLGSYLIGTWMFGLMPASYYSFSGGINWSHVALQLLAQDGIQYLMHHVEHKLDKRLYQASHKPHHKFTNPRLFDAFNGSATGNSSSPFYFSSHVISDGTIMRSLKLYANLIDAAVPPFDKIQESFLTVADSSTTPFTLTITTIASHVTVILSHTDTFLMILVPLVITARLVNANVWSYMAFGSLYANWLTLIHSEYAHPWDSLFRTFGFGTAADHHVHHKLFKYNFGHLFMYWDKAMGSYKAPSEVMLFNEGI